MENNIVIETRDLTKIYRTGNINITAVNHANVSIHAGEFVGLVGPSGSGKLPCWLCWPHCCSHQKEK